LDKEKAAAAPRGDLSELEAAEVLMSLAESIASQR